MKDTSRSSDIARGTNQQVFVGRLVFQDFASYTHSQLMSTSLFSLHKINPVVGAFVALMEISLSRIKRRRKFREKVAMRRVITKFWFINATVIYNSFD